jgi:hypothetical protein
MSGRSGAIKPVNLLNVEMQSQLDDVTCGPTCLDAIYRYYGLDIPLEEVIRDVPQLETGGTLAVLLACHALKLGFQATIYTYNLRIFDPTWFGSRPADLAEKLREQLRYKETSKLRLATDAYLEFLNLGGTVLFEELNTRLIRKHLDQGIPVLTGLSATYLYRCPRELVTTDPDDVRGEPQGHFVVVTGYDAIKRMVQVADPYPDHQLGESNKYFVGFDRLIGAILLGIMTYDANLLIIRKKTPKGGPIPVQG